MIVNKEQVRREEYGTLLKIEHGGEVFGKEQR
jgi:hypothetical protein